MLHTTAHDQPLDIIPNTCTGHIARDVGGPSKVVQLIPNLPMTPAYCP